MQCDCCAGGLECGSAIGKKRADDAGERNSDPWRDAEINLAEDDGEGAKAEDYGEGGRHAQRRLPNPYDESLALEPRVRAYWQANCAHCHVEAGGGNAKMELEWSRSLKDTGTVDVEPVHSRFQLGEEARIVASGDIGHTVMMQRISGTGTGRMPPVGGMLPDPQWIQLFAQWVSERKPVK